MGLRPADFDEFFRAIHGHRPFPWQQALVEGLADCDTWPDVLDLPTGVGKTAALDAAVFHLALRADMPSKAALRIALVVDRRLVVDDAFTRAEKIAKALCDPLSEVADGRDVVGEVARRLQQLAGDGAPPLVAGRLRGGAPLEHDWARTPTQPTILCSTVDQVGSRLLFRGYGVSDRMKPVHAGLLGVDSLILLDEAHLSQPFRQTLDAVRSIGGAKVQRVLLSATPGETAARHFSLLPKDRDHPELKKRIEARKPASLRVVRGASVAEAFATAACETMKRLKEQDLSSPAVGIVVNRVALARDTFENFRERLKEGANGGTDVILMIGRSRDVDRDRIVEALAPFRTGAKSRGRAKPLFVVATQCLEVGVDLDLDGLVTQAAPLDALRQRFGRLNRAGRPVSTEAAILACPEDIAKKADDPVYGDRIRKTWEALQAVAREGTVDFGVETLPKRLAEAGIDSNDLATERSNAPVVMPGYLDLWSWTSPRPAADPEVALFLHGADRTAAGVSIVWRGDFGEDDLKDGEQGSLDELIRLVPPRAAEAVEVPLWTARAWLGRQGESLGDMSDAPEREASGEIREPQDGRRAFRWAGSGDPRTRVVGPEDLRTGDILIVPAEYGGCDEFGWAPNSAEIVRDVADDAAEPYWGRRCAVRIARDSVRTDTQWDRLSATIADETTDTSSLVERLVEALPSSVEVEEADQEDNNSRPRDVTNPLAALRGANGRIDIYFPYGAGRENGAILVAERGIKGKSAPGSALPATEDDNASHTSSERVPLDDHSHHVAGLAKWFAQKLGLGDVADDLRLAAFLHDAGKADQRFQIMLSGGDPWNRPDGPPMAKSGRSCSPDAWTRAGLPKGWRHEALSVRMARAHPHFAEARDPALVLWLVGTHHGLGRPFFDFLDREAEGDLPPCLDVPAWQLETEEPGPQSLAFEFHGTDWPSLFEALKRRYGIWGLAHLEAVLRLADHRASEAEREHAS
ncbi:MAG: type I-U CRISPR-associated helicase/endonuclease Cas3 [Rhodospirillaceae bacterium]|nr:type I-U CRISPR-associated helicase/endonuclease Cas3 [Rhodospirillaceae bacterium]